MLCVAANAPCVVHRLHLILWIAATASALPVCRPMRMYFVVTVQGPDSPPSHRKKTGNKMSDGACLQIEAEKLVLEANMRGGLATCALRPSGIFGEHDPLFVPTLVDNARKGKAKYIIGKGNNMMEWTYVGNVAQAHIQVGMCSQRFSRVHCARKLFQGSGEGT